MEGVFPPCERRKEGAIKGRKLPKSLCLEYRQGYTIREIPDHATFREKCVNTGLVRQTWDMSLFGPM